MYITPVTPEEAERLLHQWARPEAGDPSPYDLYRALETIASLNRIYRGEMYYAKNGGKPRWRPMPGQAGRWRGRKDEAAEFVRAAKQENPDEANTIRLAYRDITIPQEVEDE